MKYRTVEELEAVLSRFEDCSIDRTDWGHPEHLIVAYLYSREYDRDATYRKMKEGIFRLLEAFGVDTGKEMPYHETLTVFWITVVHEFASACATVGILEACEVLTATFDKHYPARFYSRELLFSDEARVRFVAPDLAPIEKVEIESW